MGDDYYSLIGFNLFGYDFFRLFLGGHTRGVVDGLRGCRRALVSRASPGRTSRRESKRGEAETPAWLLAFGNFDAL